MDRLTQCLVTVAKRNVLARVAPAELVTPGLVSQALDHAAEMTPQSAWLYRSFCVEMERLWLTTPETHTIAPGRVGGSQYTRPGEIVRLPRVAEGLCLLSANDQQPVDVAPGWGAPIVDWMERVADLCSDPELDGAALLEKIDAEINALVDVAALMDIDALVNTLEAGMGGAALAGAELALKKVSGKKGLTTFAAGNDEPVIVQRGRRVAGERISPREDGTTLVQQGSATPGERIPQREDGVIATYAPLSEAVAKLDRKTPIGSKLTSAEWSRVPLALRERAQFSARVESVRFLGTVQDQMRKRLSLEKERLANGKAAFVDRGSFIQTMRRIAEEENLNTTSNASQRGSVRDIRSAKRLGLIYDMQTNQAQEYARWKMDHDADVLDAFPAQRFVRVMDVEKPREAGFWAGRWNEAGAQVNWAGARQRPMVALKTSPIWAALSIVGTPWPPFDWGSGMGLEDVDREEAEMLGLLERAEPVPDLGGGEPSFNKELQASTEGLPAEMREDLELAFGDQVDLADGKAKWRPPGRRYQTFADLGLPPATDWKLDAAPKQMDAQDAAKAMSQGYVVKAGNRSVAFTQETLDHWKDYKDAASRPTFLPHAVATVQAPNEVWRQETQDVYLKGFEKPSGAYRGCLVAVEHSGVARTFFVKNLKELNGARKGLELRGN